METTFRHRWQERLHEIIFEADTRAGKAFDVVLIATILLSVLVVMLDSIASYHQRYEEFLSMAEWIFTILFSIEYILRIISSPRPAGYIFSFYGIIDFLATIPTYLALILPGTELFAVIRLLRVLRIFRVLKLVKFVSEAQRMKEALAASRQKIFVFLYAVLTITVLVGSLMYVIEGEQNGFTSIPRSIYWSIVTLTTVGYGDLSPATPLGQLLAALIMILGYGMIAVPTGIVSVEMSRVYDKRSMSTQVCPGCSAEGHDADAVHCKHCGTKI